MTKLNYNLLLPYTNKEVIENEENQLVKQITQTLNNIILSSSSSSLKEQQQNQKKNSDLIFLTRQIHLLYELKYSFNTEEEEEVEKIFSGLIGILFNSSQNLDSFIATQLLNTLILLLHKNPSISIVELDWTKVRVLLERMLFPSSKDFLFKQQQQQQQQQKLIGLYIKFIQSVLHYSSDSSNDLQECVMREYLPLVLHSQGDLGVLLSSYGLLLLLMPYKNITTISTTTVKLPLDLITSVYKSNVALKSLDLLYLDYITKLLYYNYGSLNNQEVMDMMNLLLLQDDSIQLIYSIVQTHLDLPTTTNNSTTGSLNVSSTGTMTVITGSTQKTFSTSSSLRNGTLKAIDDSILSSTLFKKSVTGVAGGLRQGSKEEKYWTFGCFIIYSINSKINNNNNSSFNQLEKLLKLLEPLYHPSALGGRWSVPIVKLLCGLSYYLQERVDYERSDTRNGENCGGRKKYGKEFNLDYDTTKKIVMLLKPLLLRCVFSKDDRIVRMASDSLKRLLYVVSAHEGMELEVLLYGDVLQLLYDTLGQQQQQQQQQQENDAEKTSTATAVSSQPHRVNSCIGLLSNLIETIVHRQQYPKGALYLVEMLDLTLGGVDLNDPSKSFKTLSFYVKVLMNVPIVRHPDELNKEDSLYSKDLILRSELFTNWLHGMLDRLFLLIENNEAHAQASQQQESSANNGGDFSGGFNDDATPERVLMDFCNYLVSVLAYQISFPNTFKLESNAIVDRLLEFSLSKVFTRKETAECVAGMLQSFSEAHSEYVFMEYNFLTKICGRIKEELLQGAGLVWMGDSADNKDRGIDEKLIYNLRLLKAILPNFGLILGSEKYAKQQQQQVEGMKRMVEGVLEMIAKEAKLRSAYRLGFKVLKDMIGGMSDVWPTDYRSHTTASVQTWGMTPSEVFKQQQLQQNKEEGLLNVKWHIPSKEEKEWVYHLYKKFIDPQFVALTESMKNGNDQDLLKSLSALYYGLGGMAVVIPPDASLRDRTFSNSMQVDEVESIEEYSTEEETDLEEGDNEGDGMDDAFYPSRTKVKVSYLFEDPASEEYKYFVELRQRIGKAIRTVFGYLESLQQKQNAAFRKDYVELYKILLKMVRVYFNGRGMEKSRYESQLRYFQTVKRSYRRGFYDMKSQNYPRFILIRRLCLQHMTRVRNNTTVIYKDPADEPLFSYLLKVSTCRYTELRIIAQIVLTNTLRIFVKKKYSLLQEIFSQIDKLLDSTEGKLSEAELDTLKGLLFLLDSKMFMNVCLHDSKNGYQEILIMKLLRIAATVDKQSIIDMVRNIIISFSSKYTSAFFVSLDKKIVVGSYGANMMTSEKAYGIINKLIDFHDKLKNPHFNVSLMILSFFDLLFMHLQKVEIRLVKFLFETCILKNEMILVRKVAMQVFSKCLMLARIIEHEKLSDEYKYVVTESGNYDYADSDFVDRDYMGYACLPYEFKVYRSIIHFDLSVNPEIDSILNSKEVWSKFLHILSTTEVSEHYSVSYQKFFKRVFQYTRGKYFFDYIIPVLESWFQTDQEGESTSVSAEEKLKLTNEFKFKVKLFCELMAGLLHALKKWNTVDVEKFYAWFVPLLKKQLLGCAQEAIQYYYNMLHIGMSYRNYQRFLPIIKMIVFDLPLSSSPESGLIEAKKLSFKKCMLTLFHYRLHPLIFEELSKQVSTSMNSDYKMIRDSVSIVAWELSKYQFVMQKALKDDYNGSLNVSVSDSFVSPVGVGKFIKDLKEDKMPLSKLDALHELKNRKLIEDIVLKLHQSLTPGGSAPSRNVLNLAKTVLRLFVDGLTSQHAHYLVSLLVQPIDKTKGAHCFLHDLLYLQFIQGTEDPDLVESLFSLFGIIADVSIPLDNFEEFAANFFSVVHSCFYSESSESSYLVSKKSKLRILALLQVFAFRNALNMTDAHIKTVFDAVIAALCDNVLEVRQLASIALCGLTQCFYNDIHIEALRSKFLDFIKSESINFIHGGVLGLSALVLAFPYDIPVWLPDTLVALARCNSLKNQLVQTSIKQTFSEFRRTHQETWKQDVLGYHESYVEMYGYDVSGMIAGNVREEFGSRKNKGVFTPKHLQELDGFLISSIHYYA